MSVPFNNLGRQYQSIREEVLDAIDQVYRGGQVLDSERTIKFELAIANRCNRKYAIAVNSGTQALEIAIGGSRELDTREHTLIPNFSFRSTLTSARRACPSPVVCDVDNQGLIDLEKFSREIAQPLHTFGIGQIVFVNLFGNIIDYDRLVMQTELFSDNILLIEDAAQSFGSTYHGRPSGSFGTVSILSFDPTKNLPNYGSGGMILTDDEDLYKRFWRMRNTNESHDLWSTNSRMSEADCAVMLVKLKHLDRWQKRRRDIAEYYLQEFGERFHTIRFTEGVEPNWHKFVIKTASRANLVNYMTAQDIEVKIHYPYVLDNYSYGVRTRAKILSQACLSLPMYAELSDYEVEQVAIAMKSYNP